MYLTEDIIGAATRKLYAKKGETVQVINDTRDLILVQGASERFHVHPYQLSEEKVENGKVEAVQKLNKPVKKKK